MKEEVQFVELTQNHIENWSKELPKAEETTMVVYNGALVRAAVKYGWFVEKMGDVGKMKPARVKDLAQAILKEYARVMEVSPE